MFYGYKDYVSVADKQAKARRYIAKMAKKGINLSPIEPTKLGLTWWGKAWNDNLERYADYAARIGRGKTYVKNGFVLHLQISKGEIESMVAGSKAEPYSVTVKIDPLNEEDKKAIEQACGQMIDSLQSLLAGKFPQTLRPQLLDLLFPKPKAIHFGCSCPDWAHMCKHVAATLYAAGAKLDTDPMLFFTLRGIDTASLIKKSVEKRSQELLTNAKKSSTRELKQDDVLKLFGI